MNVMVITPERINGKIYHEFADGSALHMRNAKNESSLKSLPIKLMIFAPGVPEETKRLTQCRLHGLDSIIVDLDTGVVTQR